MSTLLFIDEGRHLINQFDKELSSFASRLKQTSTQVSYRCALNRESGKIVDTTTGDSAIEAIAADICKLDYAGIENQGNLAEPKLFLCSSVQIPEDHLPLLEQINTTKSKLQRWHAKVLATQPSKAEKQHYLRKVILKQCGRPLLNLDACDAQLINTRAAVMRINWNINHCRPSRRLCIKDAIDELKQMTKTAKQEKATRLNSEINALQSLKPSTPVAACYGRGVKVLRYQAVILNKNNELKKLKGHAANPIFYSGAHGQTPTFIPPCPDKKSRAGRPTIISDQCVTYSLPSWFYYKTTAAQKHKKETKARTRNPRSPISGLRLGQRRGKACVIAGSTSVSINKYGLKNAWIMAVDKLIDQGIILPADKNKAIALCPCYVPV